MGATCCRCQPLDDPLLMLPRTSVMSMNFNQLYVPAPLAAASDSASSSPSPSPVSRSLASYMSFSFPFVFKANASNTCSESKSHKKQAYNDSHSEAFVPYVGEYWRKTSNGAFVPLSLFELSVRSLCAELLVNYHDPLQATAIPPELAACMLQWLRQHSVLDKPRFTTLVPFLLLEWNLVNQREVEDSWFDNVPETIQQSVKSIDVSGCTQLQQFGSEAKTYINRLPQLIVASFKGCTQLSLKAIETLQFSTNLTALNLSGCTNVDDRCLDILKGLDHLTSLQLIGCYKVTNSGIKYLLQLEKLETLRLGRCKQVTDEAFIPFAASFLTLRELDVAYCRLSKSAMEYIAHIRSLRVLVIRGCSVISNDSMAVLAKLTHLMYFDARHCNLIHSIPREWTQLQVLLLGYTAFSESDVAVFQRLINLQELELHKCQIKKRGFDLISQLPHLERLDLEDTALIDSALLAVCDRARKLKTLNVSFTEISDSGAAGLAKLKELRVLRLDTPGITDRALANLSYLLQLECLDLFGANVSDNGLMHLIPLRNMQELTICGGNISDRGVGFISNVTSLTSLNLSQNRNIRAKSLIHLQALTNLRYLNLSNTGISAVSLRHLSPLKKLQSLSVYGCSLSRGHIDVLRDILPELAVLRCT